jgi:thymidylate synthase (FAD)
MQASYISHYLTDNDIANFARQSFAADAANFTDNQNANLIKFLARGMASNDWDNLKDDMRDTHYQGQTYTHNLAAHIRKIPVHWVPFGHPQITLKMQAPIPIRVQSFKHKIGFVESEESRRYISSKPKFYVPEHFRAQAANVKQGSAGVHEKSWYYLREYEEMCLAAIDMYEQMIADGVCAEQARFILPQGCEVNWVWTGSLYAFANFYNQRSDSHAQKEIQELASQVGAIIENLFPIAWPALTKGQY